MALVVASCGDGSSGEASPVVPLGTTIGAAGGTVSSDDGAASLDIPAGAVGSDTVISIQAIDTVALPESAREGALVAYRFGPDGLVFSVPTVVAIRVPNDALVVAASVTSDGTIEVLADQAIEVDEAGNGVLTASLGHFSDVALFGGTVTAQWRVTPTTQRVDAVLDVGLAINATEDLGGSVTARGDFEIAGVSLTADGRIPTVDLTFDGGTAKTASVAAAYVCARPGTDTISISLRISEVVSAGFAASIIFGNAGDAGHDVKFRTTVRCVGEASDGSSTAGEGDEQAVPGGDVEEVPLAPDSITIPGTFVGGAEIFIFPDSPSCGRPFGTDADLGIGLPGRPTGITFGEEAAIRNVLERLGMDLDGDVAPGGPSFGFTPGSAAGSFLPDIELVETPDGRLMIEMIGPFTPPTGTPGCESTGMWLSEPVDELFENQSIAPGLDLEVIGPSTVDPVEVFSQMDQVGVIESEGQLVPISQLIGYQQHPAFFVVVDFGGDITLLSEGGPYEEHPETACNHGHFHVKDFAPTAIDLYGNTWTEPNGAGCGGALLGEEFHVWAPIDTLDAWVDQTGFAHDRIDRDEDGRLAAIDDCDDYDPADVDTPRDDTCPTDPIFADGFESGDVTAWSPAR